MRSWDGSATFVSTSSCAGLTRMCGGVGAVLARLIPFTHAYIRLGPMVIRPEKSGYGCATVLSRFDTVVLRLQPNVIYLYLDFITCFIQGQALWQWTPTPTMAHLPLNLHIELLHNLLASEQERTALDMDTMLFFLGIYPRQDRRRRDVWVKTLLLRRPMHGHYQRLLTELATGDQRSFTNFTRVEIPIFRDYWREKLQESLRRPHTLSYRNQQD